MKAQLVLAVVLGLLCAANALYYPDGSTPFEFHQQNHQSLSAVGAIAPLAANSCSVLTTFNQAFNSTLYVTPKSFCMPKDQTISFVRFSVDVESAYAAGCTKEKSGFTMNISRVSEPGSWDAISLSWKNFYGNSGEVANRAVDIFPDTILAISQFQSNYTVVCAPYPITIYVKIASNACLNGQVDATGYCVCNHGFAGPQCSTRIAVAGIQN